MKKIVLSLFVTGLFFLGYIPTLQGFSGAQGKRSLSTLTPGSSKFSSWGVDPKNKKSNVNLSGAWKKFEKRRDIVVAVVDTGVDPQHPYLRSNHSVARGRVSLQNYGVDFSRKKSSSRPKDEHGHGTHVAAIIKSVFPGVKLLTLKYYNPKASGQENLDATIKALKYAVDQNVNIINYSGGGPEASQRELEILKRAEKKGILVVAAAGNESSNIDIPSKAYYPASYNLSNIITVTAHNRNLQVLPSSNWGKKSVDISAPGHRIKSALPKGRAGYLTGTSQATAFVSGAAGLLMAQFPGLKAGDIKKILKASAQKEITLINKCSSQGRLDVTRAQARALTMTSKKRPRVARKKKRQREGKILYRRL